MPNSSAKSLAKFLSIKDAAKFLDVSDKTLRRWEEAGKLIPQRTEGGHRRYILADLESFKRARKIKPVFLDRKALASTPKTPVYPITRSDFISQLEPRETSEKFDKASLFASLHQVQKKVLTKAFLFAAIVLLSLTSVKGAQAVFNNRIVAEFVAFNKLETEAEIEQGKVLADRTSLLTSRLDVNIVSNFSEDVNIAGDLALGGSGAIQGELTVVGDITSEADLNTVNANLTGDLTAVNAVISGDTSTGTLTINTDVFSDLTGTGLQINAGVLETTIGTSIESSEIADDSILEVDLKVSNTPTNGQVLTYNSSTGAFTWAADSAGESSPWTITSGVVYPDATTDDVAIGGTTSSAPFYFDVATKSLTLADGGFLDLSAIVHDDSATQGIKLPQNTTANLTNMASAGEGFIAWSTDEDKLKQWNGTSWANIATGGSTEWTLASGVLYPNAATTDVVVGGTSLAASIFGIDESAGNFYFGYDNSANPTLNFEATDADAGELGFNTNDSFYFSNANVGIGDTSPLALFTVGSGDLFQVNSSGQVTAPTDETINGIDINTGAVSDVTTLTLVTAGNSWGSSGLTASATGTGDYTFATDTDTVLSLDSATANADTLNITSNDSGAATFTGTLTPTDLTADRTWTLPDETGVFCLSSGNCAGGAGGSKWTDSGTVTYLTNTTDELVLGGSTVLSSAKFSIDGDADQIQLIIQGNATQTSNLLTLEQSSGTDVFTVSNSGVVTQSTGTNTSISLTRSAAGQWIGFNDGTDVWGLYNTAGSPEGTLAANTGALSMDTTNGTLYVKTDDTDNTGWVNLATGASSPFTSSGGIIDKTDATERLRLLYGDAADTQLTIENTTNGTIPTVDSTIINLTGNTTGIVTDGVDALFIAGEFGNGTTNTNSLVHLDLDPVNTPSGDETFYALNIDGITGSSATERAISVGTGWDSVLSYNGTAVINGTGQVISTQLTGTLFSTNTDTASANTIVQGDTLVINGDSNGIDVTHSGDTMTVAFDGTEVGAETWGTGSGFAWTFDAGATDPVFTFGSDSVAVTGAASTSLSGDLTVSGGDITGANSASIDIGEATSGAITLIAGTTGDFVFTTDSDTNIQTVSTTLTADGANLVDLNLTLGDDTDADAISALNIDVTSAATGDADELYGININNLSTVSAVVLETALRIGEDWQYVFEIEGTTNDANDIYITASDPGSDITVNIPTGVSGDFCFTSGNCAGVGGVGDIAAVGNITSGDAFTTGTPGGQLYFSDLGYIGDASGNELLVLDTVASAVNEVKLSNAATNTNPAFTAQGSDTNIGFDIVLKGTDPLNVSSTTASTDVIAIKPQTTTTTATFTGTITTADLTADRTWTIPDATGTVCLTTGNCAGVGGTGDVTGPGSSTDNAIARFDGTTGKTIQNSGVIISDTDAITGVTDFDIALTSSTEVDVTKTAAAAATEEGVDLTFTAGAGDGSDVYSGLRIAATSANHAASTDKLYGINIANLASADAEGDEAAIFVGTGWDNILSYNGTAVINGTGQVISTQLTGTLFTVTDGTTPQTIEQGNTLTFADGTDINFVTSATDQVTANNTSTLATVTGRGATTSTLVNLNGGYAIAPTTTGTFADFILETEWTAGDLINADFASATTLTSDVVVADLNFNTNVTGVADGDVTGVYFQTPALTSSGTTTTNYYGFRSGGGALDTSAAGGTATNVNWYGNYITAPNVDTGESGDITSSYGLYLAAGTLTDGAGTENLYGIFIENGDIVLDEDGGGALGGSTGGDLLIGEGQDLVLYHNGTNSVIDNNTGELLVISASNIRMNADNDTDDYVYFSTETNVPFLRTAGTSNLSIAPDGGTINLVGDVDISGTSGLNFSGVGGQITFQNGETIDNDSNNQVNIGLGTSGTLLLTSGTTASIINSAGALAIDAQATGLNLQADGSVDVNLAGGSGATGCTVANSTGNLTCTGQISGGTIDTALTQGSVVFAGASGVLSEDNAGFFWDDTNNELVITSSSNTDANLTLVNNTATTIGAGANTLGVADISSTSLTTGNLLNLETTTTLTSGRVLNVGSTSTALTTGSLGYFNWNPGSATTSTGDLFAINIGSNASTSGSLFKISDNGSTLFSVTESQITNAIPTQFTASGDTTFAYDIQFTNQTASYIKSKAPLYIQAGESFESNNLTLQTYNNGDVVFENGDSGVTATFGGAGTNTLTNSTTANSGKAVLILDQYESQDIFTASASGSQKFTIQNDGDLELDNALTLSNSDNNDLNVVENSLTLNLDFGEATGSTITYGATSTGLAFTTTTSGNISLTAGGTSDYVLATDSDTTLTLDSATANADNFALTANNTGAGTFTGTLTTTDLTADRTWTFPDATGDVCLSSGNCAGGAGGSKWTDSGTTVYLTDTTDELVLGGTSPLSSAKFSIDGDADQIQLLVQGNATQTSNLLTLEQSDGTDVFTVTNAGVTTVIGNINANGGLDIDDAFVVADGGILTTSQTANFDGTADFDGAVDFSGGVTNSSSEFLFSGGNLQLNDSINLTLGTGDDLTLVHNGTNTLITSATGDLIIDNTLATGSTIFDLGTDTSATDVLIRNNSGSTLFSVNGAGVTTVTGDLDVTLTSSTEVDITKTSAAAATEEGIDLTFTAGAGDGSDVYSGIRIAATSANHAASSDKLYGLNIANLSSADAEGDEAAIFVGTGWDSLLSYNGTTVINGSGEVVGAQITDDSLDFTEFQDTLDLDAALILNQATNTWTQNFTGDTTTGLTYNANSLTTGTGILISSSGTIASGGELMQLTANSATTGDVLGISATGLTTGRGQFLNLASTDGTAGTLRGSHIVLSDTGAVASGTDTTYGQYIDVTRTGASAGSITSYGIYTSIIGDTAGTSDATGIYGVASNADTTFGGRFSGEKNGTTALTTVYGASATANNNNTGSISTAYGLYTGVNNDAGGTISTGYGLYIDSVGATTDYGIYQFNTTDENYFAGNVGIGDTTPTEGNLVIAGSADGTDALYLTAGDIFVNNGDLDVNGGDFNVTLDSADEVDVTKTAAAAATEEGIDLTFTSGAGDGSDVYSALRIAATSANHAASSDKLYGINIANLASADAEGDESALYIGTSWDKEIEFADTTPIIAMGNTGTLAFTDGTNTLISIKDIDSSSYGRLFINPKTDAGNPASCTAGDIYTNSNDNNIYYCESANSWVDLTAGGAGATPGGSDTEIQYNNGGAFGGTSVFTYNDSTLELTISDDLTLNLAEAEDLSLAWSVSGTQSGQGQYISVTNSSSSGTQYALSLDNLASTGTTDALLALTNTDADTSVTNAIYLAAGGAGTDFTNGINLSDATTTVDLVLDDGLTIAQTADNDLTFTENSLAFNFDFGEVASTIQIETASSFDIESSANVADSIVLNSTAGGIDITTASTEDIDITGTGGINISSSEVAADALALTVSGGTTATLSLNSNGTGTAAIDINVTGSGGDIDIDANDAITIDADDFSIDAVNPSNISIASDGAADDLTISVTGATDSSLILSSSGTAADALQITSSAGGIDITANGAAAGEDIDISASSSINISSSEAVNDAIVLSTSNAAGGIDITSSSTTVDAIDVNLNSLTSGKGFDITSTSTSLSTGSLMSLDWSATGSIVSTANLFNINVGSGEIVNTLFRLQDNGSDIFKVGQSTITSALPHEFTAAGDVSVAYDLAFTNQTSSFIKSNAPLTIEAGESFENNSLTLKTYGSGQVTLDSSFNGRNVTSRDDETGASTNTITGRGMVYYLHANSNTTDTSFTTDYNITGVPDTYGTILHINSVAEKGATVGARVHTVEININGTQVSAVATTSTTAADTVRESYTIVRSYDAWKIVGSTGTSDSADYAENYKITPEVEAAEVVAISLTDPLMVEPANSANASRVIGIASTKAGFLIGDEFDSQTLRTPIALAGRVPVKVAPTSQAINPGDLIGASEVAGYARKVDGGYIVGRALESWTPGSGDENVLVFVNPIYVADATVESSQYQVLSDRVDMLEIELGLNSPGATESGELNTQYEILNTTDLSVSGDATLGDVTITGTLQVGTTIFDGFNNSINTAGVLKIQDLALGNIEFLDGLITFDTEGNIKANEVTAKKFNVAGASAGNSTLPANALEVFIETDQVTLDSLIFITPETSTSRTLAVTEKQEGVGFKVKISREVATDVKFNWWIVGKEN